MMARETFENANPTILDASQLPSRREMKNGLASRGLEFKHGNLVSLKDIRSWGASSHVSAWPSDDAAGGCEDEPIDEQEIYDLISNIKDPEHPYTLGALSVVNLSDIHIDSPLALRHDSNTLSTVLVDVTPTITHCSMATIIGLAVRIRLERALPPNFRIDVKIKKGSHTSDDQVNKQLADKERVAAALENETLRNLVEDMLRDCV